MTLSHNILNIKGLVLPLILFFTCHPSLSFAQNNSKHLKYYNKAYSYFNNRDYAEALRLVDKAISLDSLSYMAWLLKADILLETSCQTQAVPCLEKALAIDSLASPRSALTLSKLYIDNRLYADAIVLLHWCLTLDNQNDGFKDVASQLLALSCIRKDLVENPVCSPPLNVGANINTDGDEYVNQVLPHTDDILFTRRSAEIGPHGFRNESLLLSTLIDNELQESRPLTLGWSDEQRTGSASLSQDSALLFFVGFDWLGGYGRGDIFVAQRLNSTFCLPFNLGPLINTTAMESQPFISADGNEFFFVRYSNSKQKADIFCSQLIDGQWSKPKPLHNVNTDANEMSPFLSIDGTTLFFASDRDNSMGGYDLFFSRRDRKGEWGAPSNIGFPINTEANEICFVVDDDGSRAYLSSDRDGGFGGYDVFSCQVENLVLADVNDFSQFLMRNINFEFDSSVIDESSDAALDSLAIFLNHNTLDVEISGHADDTGGEEYNMRLSLQRAESVKAALVARAVDPARISTAGYGDTLPVAPNDNDENKALNRRVEIRFLK
ncbi:MAG: OmpA family protein [Bacteroidales bacterium]|nr:OmpA family protein [Bacteroidales bacterium]